MSDFVKLSSIELTCHEVVDNVSSTLIQSSGVARSTQEEVGSDRREAMMEQEMPLTVLDGPRPASVHPVSSASFRSPRVKQKRDIAATYWI